MEHANHEAWDSKGGRSAPDHANSPDTAIARILVRRDASRHSLKQIEDFLRKSALGRYTIGQFGSARSGYWTAIEVRDRRDLDRIRERYRLLIDGWQELR